MSIDPGEGEDGGVGMSTVPPTIYSHSIGIDMPLALKTKINLMKTYQTTSKYISMELKLTNSHH